MGWFSNNKHKKHIKAISDDELINTKQRAIDNTNKHLQAVELFDFVEPLDYIKATQNLVNSYVHLASTHTKPELLAGIKLFNNWFLNVDEYGYYHLNKGV